MSERAVVEKPGTTTAARIHSVDGLRALAFMLVFLFHSWEFAGRPRVPIVTDLVQQNTRPDLFVVITGFALYLPFAVDPSRHDRFSTGNYLERRLKRIVLPYYAALVLALALPYLLKALYRLVGGQADPTEPVALGDLVAHLTFTHLFFPDYWAGINGSLWTMSLEMQLYLLFPLLLWAFARWGVRALLGASALSVTWHLLGPLFVKSTFPEAFLWGATGIGRLVEFSAGMVAAVVVMRHRERLAPGLTAAVAGVMVAGYMLSTGFGGALGWFPLRELGLALSFGALLILAIGVASVERVFALPVVSGLGYVSYSMFLVHQPIVYYFSEFLERGLRVPEGHLQLAVLWTVGLALVVLAGRVFYEVVEKPCIRWSRSARRHGESSADRRAFT